MQVPKLPTNTAHPTPHEPHKTSTQLVTKPVLLANNETILQGPKHANPKQSVPSVKQRRKSATPMKIRLKALQTL